MQSTNHGSRNVRRDRFKVVERRCVGAEDEVDGQEQSAEKARQPTAHTT